MRLQNMKMLAGMMLSVLMSAGAVYPAIARPVGEAGIDQLLSQTNTNQTPSRNQTDTNQTPSPTTNQTPSPTTTNQTPSQNQTDTNQTQNQGQTNTIIRREQTIQQRSTTETSPTTAPAPAVEMQSAPASTPAPAMETQSAPATEPVRALW